ncbi:hypothetical protein [Hymenobacter sp. PAMC 26628]|uniref:hypothetical protein n=1 Tax=Hymenobacter sp. PAMC 26628 TaxID=1484118 RepID=UPI0007703D25|nr:hypothetical protein [Hymenobacter sp. PAMC 26628]AMJ65375.1 hypothetical protein AXW84_07980 [Hymenobacter sp. PAMC 26628]
MLKSLLLLLLLLAPPTWRALTWVHDRNATVGRGQTAYARGDDEAAAQAFAAAAAARPGAPGSAALLLNLGHAQRRAGQTAAARATYGQLLDPAVPPALGSVARQQLAVLAAAAGETAPALGLLRQALRLDPTNAGARYNYEVLSAYLARHRAAPRLAAPTPPGPSPAKSSGPKPPAPTPPAANQPAAGTKAGTDRAGQVPDLNRPAPTAPSAPKTRPDAAGRPDPAQASAAPGAAASGRRAPKADGVDAPVPTGAQAGATRGLDENTGLEGASGRSRAAGAEAARATDAQLQTQRERLQAMDLSPVQTQQLLDALKAQEQQYLQQVPRRRAGAPARRGQPTW